MINLWGINKKMKLRARKQKPIKIQHQKKKDPMVKSEVKNEFEFFELYPIP